MVSLSWPWLAHASLTSRPCQVYVDGGVRRGSDVIKALALGAKAVGIGRPTLYAMAGYGSQGVEHVFQVGSILSRGREQECHGDERNSPSTTLYRYCTTRWR